MRSVNAKTYLPDFFNSSSENINDNKPLLHTWSWFHLHQHSVSKEHEECQVGHLQNTQYIIHMHKNLKFLQTKQVIGLAIGTQTTGTLSHFWAQNLYSSSLKVYFILFCFVFMGMSLNIIGNWYFSAEIGRSRRRTIAAHVHRGPIPCKRQTILDVGLDGLQRSLATLIIL